MPVKVKPSAEIYLQKDRGFIVHHTVQVKRISYRQPSGTFTILAKTHYSFESCLRTMEFRRWNLPTFLFADLPVRVRRDVQPPVRGAVHAAQRDGVGRDARRAVAGAGGARQAAQLARPRALRVRQEPHVQEVSPAKTLSGCPLHGQLVADKIDGFKLQLHSELYKLERFRAFS